MAHMNPSWHTWKSHDTHHESCHTYTNDCRKRLRKKERDWTLSDVFLASELGGGGGGGAVCVKGYLHAELKVLPSPFHLHTHPLYSCSRSIFHCLSLSLSVFLSLFLQSFVYVWHDSWCVSWLFHVCHDGFMCAMTHLGVPWLILRWGRFLLRGHKIEINPHVPMIHSYIPSLINMCDMNSIHD